VATRLDGMAGSPRSADDTPVALIRPLDPPRGRSRRRDGSVAEGGGRRNVRRAVRAGLLVLVVIAGYLGVSLYQVWSTGRSHHDEPVDAIVVMGAAQYDGRPSPQLAARLDHAAALWPTGQAGLVVVTGGNRPGDRFTEAEAAAAYLEERGVPAGALLLEDHGRSSYESLRGVAELLRARGLDEVLIVTDPYHALRSKLIAEDVGLDAHVSPTPTSVVRGGDQVARELQEAAGVAIGRLIGFEHL
jgi:uncharacterized SAM-binding protein YcdF (DUF218 family)